MAGTMQDSPATVERSTRTDLVPVAAPYSLAPYTGMPWGGISPRPEMLTAGPDPLSLLRAFKRRWLLASGCGLLLGLVAMLAAWFFVPVNSDVAALIRVRAVPESFLGQAQPNPFEVQSYKATQIQLIMSPSTLRLALREAGISQLPIIQQQADPVAWLGSELRLSYPKDSEILVVAMSGDEPDQLAKIVNAVVLVYFKQYVWEYVRLSKEQKGLLQTKYQALEKKVSDLRKEMQVVASAIGGDEQTKSTQMNVTSGQLATLRSEQQRLSGALNNAEIEKMRNGLLVELEQNPTRKEAIKQKAIAEDPRLIKMKDELIEVEMAIDQEIGRAKGNPRAGQRYKTLHDQMLQRIDERKRQLEDQFEDMGLESREGEYAAMAKVAAESVAKYADQLQKIAVEIDNKEKELKDIKFKSAELDSKRAEIEQYEAIMQRMFTELQTKEIDANAPERVSKIEDAEKPPGTSAFRKYLLVGFASVFGFVVGGLGIAFREFQVRRIGSSMQITDGLGMRVVGALPSVAKAGRGSGGADVHGMLIESIDAVRTNLIHTQTGEPTQVVMITSALDREGKTTVASQLAASLARCGRRALLIDGDLRRPAAHQLFEMPLEPGLCEVLRGEMEIDDVIRPTRAAGLWMIPAGQYDLESIQALSKEGLGDVFESLRQRFEFIVVDSAPVLTIADSLMLGQHVDTVILSVVRDVSQAPKVYEACERLRAVGMQILGVVVNGERSAATYRAYAVRG